VVAKNHSDAGLLVLGSLLYTAGSAILYVLPTYLTELNTQLGINEAQMGSITGAENIGIALASIVSMLWLTRVNRRMLAVAGAAFCAVLNIMAFFSRRFELLVAARFLTGLLGEGILFALAFVVLGSSRDPDRAFGIGLTAVVTFGSLVLGTSTYLDRVSIGTGALLPLAIVPLGILFAVKWMPRTRSATASPMSTGAKGATGRFAFLAVAGMAIWFAAPGAFWTFAEGAATDHKVTAGTISLALAIGNAVGLLGSVMAAWQGDRWGRARPILVSTACLCLSVVGFEQSRSVIALALALSAFNVFWNYATVYEMALVVALDTVGRTSPAISAAQVMGFAAGGFLSGLAIFRAGYDALPAVVSLFALGGVLILALCFRVPKLEPHRG
jgi:predicted MFS family arabinose efflux permease